MPFDLQNAPQVIAAQPVMARQHAIYLEAQRSNHKVRRPRDVADVLERGQRSKSAKQTAQLVDVTV